ncbi:MAG: hypothetical protein LC633_04490 [Desulfobulbaceae bacterium]|nr:hypothetical protein [Desulfobulbaceae bacterium]
MKKIIISLFLTCFLAAATLSSASAMEGWEAGIKVSSDRAASTLAFGQQPDATDLADGLYDVPAMLSGTMQVYFLNEEDSFWRDIRGMGSYKVWRLVISSQTGEPVTLSWNPADLPAESEVKLINEADRQEIDMKDAEEYSLGITPESSLLIEATNY